MRHDGDFAAYTAARWPAIVRSLVLLGCPQPEAEEVARQGLARCYLAWGRVREADDIDVRVYREVLDCRDRAGAGTAEPAEPGPAPVAGDATDAVLVRHALEAALGRLPDEDRSAVVLRFAAGLSEVQVSELLELTTDEVESRLSDAVAALDLPKLWGASR
ncbi:hypothetical protein GCM10009844_17350 [Nocardioides koreensis]|uniref:RNA polymerase sigma factor 70 region 4 type 2 domain-containing protein n=1 Tax=Nocardioides koreensis TaxID=433651 RepID=A0ABN2ZLW4_9ACTN